MPRNVISYFNRSRVIALLQQGFSQSEVAEIVGVTQSAVSKINKKFQDTNDIKDRPRSGRRRCTTVAQDRQVALIALQSGNSISWELARLKEVNV